MPNNLTPCYKTVARENYKYWCVFLRDIAELRERMISKAKAGIKSSYNSEEYALIQSVNAINELNRSYNLIFERLSEWFGIYFPDVKVGNPYSLSKLVQAVASKGRLSKDDVESITGKNETSDELYEKMSNTISRELGEEERSAISRYAEIGVRMEESKLALESYIKASTERLLPNTAFLTDSTIAAELLSKAGSLDRLVMMPAGTIQLLGAEKALFKHIKFGSKPPKYGVLFRLPAIAQARADVRGRLARAYSAKIATALKADIMTKRFIGDELKSSLDKSVERILQSPPKQRRSKLNMNQREIQNRSNEGSIERDYMQGRRSTKERRYINRAEQKAGSDARSEYGDRRDGDYNERHERDYGGSREGRGDGSREYDQKGRSESYPAYRNRDRNSDRNSDRNGDRERDNNRDRNRDGKGGWDRDRRGRNGDGNRRYRDMHGGSAGGTQNMQAGERISYERHYNNENAPYSGDRAGRQEGRMGRGHGRDGYGRPDAPHKRYNKDLNRGYHKDRDYGNDDKNRRKRFKKQRR